MQEATNPKKLPIFWIVIRKITHIFWFSNNKSLYLQTDNKHLLVLYNEENVAYNRLKEEKRNTVFIRYNRGKTKHTMSKDYIRRSLQEKLEQR